MSEMLNDHVHDDTLHLYVLGRLSPNELETFERHVFQCDTCRQRLAATTDLLARLVGAQRIQRSDRRSEPRFRASDTASVRLLSPLVNETWPAKILDVSKNGLGLELDRPLSREMLVQVRIGKTFVLGEVVYSRSLATDRFHIGIRLLDVV